MVKDRDGIKAQLDALTAQHQTATQRAAALELDLALVGRGVPMDAAAEARVAVEAYWSRLPEQGRPSVAEWVRSLDPAQAPRAVAAYLSPAAPAAAASSSSPVPPAAVGSPTPGVAAPVPASVPSAAPAQPTAPPPTSPTAALQAANQRLSAAIRANDTAEIDRAKQEVQRLLVAPSARTV